MTIQTHVILQLLVGAAHTFLAFPGVVLTPNTEGLIHAVLMFANGVIAATAHRSNTDGTPQTVAFKKQGEL